MSRLTSKESTETKEELFSRSLQNKIINEEYRLTQKEMEEKGKYILSFTNSYIEPSFLSKKVHSITINPQTHMIEVNYLKHKLKRKSIEDDDNNKQLGQYSNKPIKEIIDSRLNFYNKESVKHLLNSCNYVTFINKFTSKKIISNEETEFSNYGLPVTFLYYMIEQYSFLNNLLYKDISPNLLRKEEKNLIQNEIVPNSLFLFLYKIISTSSKNGTNNKTLFTGESGMGKTTALYLLTYILRLNPYNIVLTIFEPESFMQHPITYLIKEFIFSFSYLYKNNSLLDIKELYELFNETGNTSITYEQIITKIVILIRKVLNAYDNELMIYIIVDSYEKIIRSELGKKYMQILNEKIDELKSDSCGFENPKFYSNVKVIEMSSTDSENSDEMIKERISKIKGLISASKTNQELVFGDSIVFLSPKEIFTKNEIEAYITNKISLSANEKKNIFYFSCYNLSVINFIISNCKDFSIDTISGVLQCRYNTQIDIVLSHQKNSSILNEEENKVKHIYDIFSYMKINDIKEKFLYSFYNGNYLNYNYNIVIPILQKSTEPKENDVISFKIKNNTFFKYINDYNYDAHYKKIIFNKISFDFLKKTYNETKSSVLRGILLEEMLYYLFKENFEKRKTITIAISVYGKQNNFVFDNYLRLSSLDVCEKSQSKDDDFFEKNFNTMQNGIYFLSHQFPCIDAVIYQDNVLYLIQIKKTITYEHVYKIQKDFHYFDLMTQNENFYKEMCNQNEFYYRTKKEDEKYNTKLNFWVNLVKIIKKNPKIKMYYVFAYKAKAYGFDVNVMYSEIKGKIEKEFIEKNEFVKQKLYCEWKGENKVENKYYVDKINNDLMIKCNKVKGNILMCSLDDMIKEFKGKRQFAFSSLLDD